MSGSHASLRFFAGAVTPGGGNGGGGDAPRQLRGVRDGCCGGREARVLPSALEDQARCPRCWLFRLAAVLWSPASTSTSTSASAADQMQKSAETDIDENAHTENEAEKTIRVAEGQDGSMHTDADRQTDREKRLRWRSCRTTARN